MPLLPSALPPKGEARRYVANDFLNLIALPQWGRLRYEDTAFLDTTPFPMGKAKRRRLRRPKGSQPRLAALGSPFQGKGLAWTLPPSFLWQEVPRRGGGWMEKRYEKERGRSSQVRHYTRAPYPPLTRSPFPKGEGCDTRMPLFSHRQSEYRIHGEKE